MPLVPWWALFSSGFAPVSLIVGWVTATTLQPPRFDPLTQTISALAAHGATDRWLMTSVFVIVGVCYIVTACGLAAVRAAARVSIFLGGTASVLVAFSPEPAGGGTTTRHILASGAAFIALALWPCLSIERGPRAPWVLRPLTAILFTALVAVLAGWFLFELQSNGLAGLAERIVTALQAIWPVIVVVGLRRASVYARPSRRAVLEHHTADAEADADG